MTGPLSDPLRGAIESMRHTTVDEASLAKALARAREIDSAAQPSATLGGDDRPTVRTPPARPMPRTWQVVAAAVALAVAVGLIGTWIPGNAQLAFAEVREAMEGIQAAHLLIRSEVDGAGGPVEIWYERGKGIAMHGSVGWEIDNGESRWEFSRAQNLVVRTASRLKDASYPDVQRLGKTMGFFVDDVPPSLPRLPEADARLDGESCQAYVWNMDDKLPPEAKAGLPDELRAERRVVFVIDAQKRVRRCEHQRGLDGKWTAYRTVEVSYPKSVDAARFEPKLADDVQVVEAAGDAAIDPDVARLVKGLEQRQAKYHGLEFRYDVTMEVKLSPEDDLTDPANDDRFTDGVLRSRDWFAILPPAEGKGRPWRRWKRAVPVEDSGYVLDRFSAFDGQKTHSYIRRPKSTRGRQALGFVLPFERSNDFQMNYFDSFLFLRPNGIDDTQPISAELSNLELRDLNLDRLHVVGRRRTDGGEVYRLHATSPPEFGTESIVEITAEPDCIITLLEIRYPKKNNELLLRYHVDSIGRLGDVAYPQKGTYREAPIGYIPDITYAFEVTSVEKLPDDARQAWFPEWPAGTFVSDQATGENFHVPASTPRE